MQHHAVLHTKFTVFPPSSAASGTQNMPHLLVNLVQGSYFTVLPVEIETHGEYVPEWHAGNIYNLERALPRAANLPTPPSLTQPTVYDLFVSGDYEVRVASLFYKKSYYRTFLYRLDYLETPTRTGVIFQPKASTLLWSLKLLQTHLSTNLPRTWCVIL